jgi:hypothetical protein
METIEELIARLKQRQSAAAEAKAPSTFTGPLQDQESMRTLTDEIKEFIVKGLACFDTPSQVVDAVKVTFGIEVSRQQVYVYSPTCSQPPSPRWRELYAATRQAYLREVAEIGIAQKTVRLAMLDRMAQHAMAHNRTNQAAEFLEQAAKECGGIYENRRPIVLQLPVPEPTATQPSALPNGHAGMIEAAVVRQLPDRSGAAGT